MKALGIGVLLALLLTLGGAPAQAQETGPSEPDTDAGEEMEEVREVIVVTASRTEQQLRDVPAALTVLQAEDLDSIPADDYGDFLRNVPGLNVSQMSARDIQISGRQATNSLADSQLVLLDNRTIYLDFFGFVMWDFLPLNPREIKQIEVVRGPGSAVWGANAVAGVVNLITKRPREMQGTSLTLGGGELGTAYGSITHAGATEKVGYKLSGSFYEQDPFDRPTGTVPGSQGPTNPIGTPYPRFENQGTSQPKANLRIDWDQSPDTIFSVSAGWAATDGIIHSGIGPFDIQSGSSMSFVKADWTRRALRVTAFANLLDGDADNLLAVDPTGRQLNLAFESETYNIDLSDTRVVGEKNIFTYGATARRNEFDLSIAPKGDKREEYGAFLQDEILLGDRVRWMIGARWDDIDPIGSVFTPRTSLVFSPRPDHTFRVSYNRAFRTPSMINNFLDITIISTAVLPPIPPLVPQPTLLNFPSQAVGNIGLQEERLDAYEVGYVGGFGSTTFTASVYRNELNDSIDFYTSAYYDSSLPPPGWPLPPFLPNPQPPPPFIGTVPEETFPLKFSYRNIGEIVHRGVELSLQGQQGPEWSWFLNYTWQDEPEVTGIDQVQLPNGELIYPVNTPPENLVNFGAAWDRGSYFANANINYTDEAFWTDVLDARFYGPTDSFVQVNLGLGARFSDERFTVQINGQNIFDEDVQQHVFGDIISRKVTGQVMFRW